MENEQRIIEINGVKLELDMRNATMQNVETFKVGDSVKVLIKKYGDKYESKAGVIIGFDAFKKLPTIIVAYLEADYSKAELKFVYLNSQSEDIEMCAASPNDVPFERDTVLDMMDRDIASKETAAEQAKKNKELFLATFNRYFADYAKVAAEVDAV